MAENTTKPPVLQGSLRERPLPRLLQQLCRKKFTGHFVIKDQTQDESEVYLREGAPVHVQRPVDTDRLDHLLVELSVLPADLVARAVAQLGQGVRLGEALERMGALDKQKLAQVLKTQLVRKLVRLFFVTDGSYTVYASSHTYGEGEDLSLMRVDPRSLIHAGIRAAYDLRRVNRELGYLAGQRFRMAEISPAFVAAMGIAPDDAVVAALRRDWLTLEDLDRAAPRPFEVRAVVLALYYADVLLCGSAEPADIDLAAAKPGLEAARMPTPVPLAPEGLRPAPMPAATPPVPPVPSVSATGSRPAPTASGPQASGVHPPWAGAAAHEPASPGGRVPRPATDAAGEESLRATILELDKKLGSMTHFELLGVSQNATSAEVETAFLRAARRFHPDRLAGGRVQDLQPMAERILARINEAAMILGNPARRADYVASLAIGLKASQTSLPTVLEGENQFLKGEVHLRKGEYAKAIESFTLAIQGNPSEPQYRAYLAWARFEDPKARKEALAMETLRTLETVIRDRPKFGRGHFWLGQIWKFLNQTDRAAQAFRAAEDIDTSLIEASRELRLIEMRKHKADSGKSDPPRRGGGASKSFKR